MTKTELKKLNGDLWSTYAGILSLRRDMNNALEILETRLRQQMGTVSQEVIKLEKQESDKSVDNHKTSCWI